LNSAYDKILKKISPKLQSLFWDITKVFPPEESDPEWTLLDHQISCFCLKLVSSTKISNNQKKELIELIYSIFTNKSELLSIRTVKTYLDGNIDLDEIKKYEGGWGGDVFSGFTTGLRFSIFHRYPDNPNAFSLFFDDLKKKVIEEKDNYELFFKDYIIEENLPKNFKNKFIKGFSGKFWVSYEFNPKYIMIYSNAWCFDELYARLFYLASMYKLGLIDITPPDGNQILWIPDTKEGGLEIADSDEPTGSKDKPTRYPKKNESANLR